MSEDRYPHSPHLMRVWGAAPPGHANRDRPRFPRFPFLAETAFSRQIGKFVLSRAPFFCGGANQQALNEQSMQMRRPTGGVEATKILWFKAW